MWWSPITTSTTWPSSCLTPFPSMPSSSSSSRAKVRAGEMWGPRWGQPLAPVTRFIPPVHYGSWFEHIKGWLGQRQLLDIIYVTYEELHQVSPASLYPPSPHPPPRLPSLHLTCRAQDLRGTAQRLCSFLGITPEPGTLLTLEQHCSFAAMRDNAMANYTLIPCEIMDHSQGRFMRKGEGRAGHGRGHTGAPRARSQRCHPAGVVGDWRSHFSPPQNALFDRVYREEMCDTELSAHWAMV